MEVAIFVWFGVLVFFPPPATVKQTTFHRLQNFREPRLSFDLLKGETPRGFCPRGFVTVDACKTRRSAGREQRTARSVLSPRVGVSPSPGLCSSCECGGTGKR